MMLNNVPRPTLAMLQKFGFYPGFVADLEVGSFVVGFDIGRIGEPFDRFEDCLMAGRVTRVRRQDASYLREDNEIHQNVVTNFNLEHFSDRVEQGYIYGSSWRIHVHDPDRVDDEYFDLLDLYKVAVGSRLYEGRQVTVYGYDYNELFTKLLENLVPVMAQHEEVFTRGY